MNMLSLLDKALSSKLELGKLLLEMIKFFPSYIFRYHYMPLNKYFDNGLIGKLTCLAF